MKTKEEILRTTKKKVDQTFKHTRDDLYRYMEGIWTNGYMHGVQKANGRKWKKAEEPPPANGKYLVFAEYSFVPDHVDQPGTANTFMVATYTNGYWYGRSLEKVFYWMPIPGIPEEE
jgi:hypothetical protein